jgi:hypothetical protein
LEHFAEVDPILNGFIISFLTDLKAVEAAPVMERAFAADCVDISIQGDWEDTQIELGLLQERQTPRPRFGILGGLLNLRHPPQIKPTSNEGQKLVQQRQAKRRNKVKDKARRKQRKKSRRKKRKRK